MDYVIGIDGGGTKTAAVVADKAGKIVAQSLVGPTNPNVLCNTVLESTIIQLFKDLNQQAPSAFSQTVCLFAGMSGVGTKKQHQAVATIIHKIVNPMTNVHIQTDSINALYSGTFGKPGVVQIAGTGSITYGISRTGESTRLGGWGYLFGDEGSGYDIGRKGLIKVIEAEEGRGEKTELKDILLQYFNVANVRNMVEKIYHANNPKDEISTLSKMVFNAYKQHDQVAVEIVEDVAKVFVFNLQHVYQKLFSNEKSIPAVLAGGVFTDQEVLPFLIKKELGYDSFLSVTLPDIPPVAGSVIGALKQQEIKITGEIINTLQTTFSNPERKGE